MNLPGQGNECDQWPGSCLDHLVTCPTPSHVSFIALIKSLAFVLRGWGGDGSGVGAWRCEYFHFLFVLHSHLAGSRMDTLYGVS